ncbi:MAG: fibronectin type III domain-containing protein [Candidatus Paceibacterota bacterium]|jgi:hypothetical protein
MHKKYNKFLIVSFILIALLGVYSYFYKDLTSEAATSNSSITSSLNTAVTSLSQVGSDGAVTDTAFLMKLDSLKKIKIDTSLLESKPFKLLINNNIKLEPVPYGRVNPFAPTDNPTINNNVVNNTPAASIKVNPPTQITDKSAIVSGSLDGAKSNNIYFEYGIADTFGKTTPKVTPSLVGNFSYKITGLSSGTTYFFRATANINGVLTFSDTISFNTN